VLRSLAIARLELRILSRDPLPIVLLFALPLAVVAFLRPALALALFTEGHVAANGSEQAIPGVVVTFSFFVVGFVGLAFYREHGWGTWWRLKATAASPAEIVAGKVLPILGISAVQAAFLFLAGTFAFGFRPRGPAIALAPVCAALVVCSVALGLAVAAVSRTLQQVNIVANLGTVVLAGLGGALVPLSLLPGWAQRLAPVFPSYWAMRGFRSVVLDGGGLTSVALPSIVLLGYAMMFVAGALAGFRADEEKVSWA